MEQIIKQIVKNKLDLQNDYSDGFNDGLGKAVEILRKQTVIKAKALRRKGTNDIWMQGKELDSLKELEEIDIEIIVKEDK